MFNDPRVWPALALAFILGWLVDWLFEILFWRGRRLQTDGKMLRQKLAVQEARLRELEQALNAQRATGNGARVAQLTEELRATRAELAEAQQLLTRQAQELDALRVAQETADAETAEVLPIVPDEAALPEEILRASEEEQKAERAPEPEPSTRSLPAQPPTPSHRLDDEARRVAALLSGRPYEPPSSPAPHAGDPTAAKEDVPPIPIDELAAAPVLPETKEEEGSPSTTPSEETTSGGVGEPHAGSDVESTEKRPRSRRRSR
jgi:hypothetical protein